MLRIVSLVPSLTELLFDLGLENEIVGISQFCIHPEAKVKKVKKVGGVKKVNIAQIEALNPDLIIANKEENDKEQVLYLMKKYSVYVSEIKTLKQALESILKIGELTLTTQKAKQLVQQIQTDFLTPLFHPPLKSVAYLIWKNPYMSINGDTFINDMIEKAGFINVFKSHQDRYPQISLQDIKNLKADCIFLSSEPYSFNDKDMEEIKKEIPHRKVVFVDGEIFSWYGSHLLQSKDYFKKLNTHLSRF